MLALLRTVASAALLLLLTACTFTVPIGAEGTDDGPPGAPAPGSASPTSAPAAGSALATLALLEVKGRAPMTGYGRDMFGQAWLDTNRNGCDTRNDMLAAHLTDVVLEPNGCVVLSGVLDDPYTGTRIDFYRGHGALVDIDHVVSLGNSWATGSAYWTMQQRAALANDPLNLLPVDAGANRQKSDGDAATWLPRNKSYRCAFVARQITVKHKYGLWVTPPEAAAMERILVTCPDQPLAADDTQMPTATDHVVREPTRATPTPSTPDVPGDVRYANCTEARAAGAAPVRADDPGYGRHLDGDGDGIGCQ